MAQRFIWSGRGPAIGCGARALFKLTQVAAADICFVGKTILRKASCIAQAAQICGEDISQIHARSHANRSKYAPRYIEQNFQLSHHAVVAGWGR